MFKFYLLSFVLTVSSFVAAQREDNYSLAGYAGYYAASVEGVATTFSNANTGETYGYDPTDIFGVRGLTTNLDLRYGASRALNLAISVSASLAENGDYEMGSFRYGGRRLDLFGSAQFAILSVRLGAFWTPINRARRLQWELGGYVTYALHSLKYTAGYEVVEINGRLTRTNETTNTTGSASRGFAPSTRLSYRVAGGFGLSLEALAGVTGNRNNAFGYYSLTGGLFFHFGGKE